MLNDFRYGFRMLLKNPGFTAVAVLSLALGIGANVAIFSLLNALMLRSLPIPEPSQLVRVGRHSPGEQWGSAFPYLTFQNLRNHCQTLSGLFAFSATSLRATMDGRSERVTGLLVSGSYYPTLRVPALLGRTLSSAEDATGTAPGALAVISYRYWQVRFGQDPGLVGRSIALNGVPFTIVGVTPPEFFGVEVGAAPDITVPLVMLPQLQEANPALESLSDYWLHVMGRLKPGIPAQQAQAELTGLYQSFRTETTGSNPTRETLEEIRQETIELLDGSRGISALREQFSQPLFVLMSMVGLILLIACANVANLLLGRSIIRRQEMVVRLALGASRFQLLGQLLTESLLLAVMGGICGLLLARWGSDVVVSLVEQGTSALETRLDLRVLVFTFALSFFTVLLFGLVPAWITSGASPGLQLKGSPQGRGSAVQSSLGKVLVIAQLALSMLLLSGAGLLIRTLQNLIHQDPGFRRHQILLFRIDPSEAGFKGSRFKTFQAQLLERIGALPGVQSVSYSYPPPLTPAQLIGGPFVVQGRPPQPDAPKDLEIQLVGPGFFETMGIPLLMGRTIGVQDHEQAPRVAVLAQSMARRFFGTANPIGGRLFFQSRVLEIVGVVRDTRPHTLRDQAPPMVYVSYLQLPTNWGPMAVEVCTSVDAGSMMKAVRQEVVALSSEIPITDMKTIETQIEESLNQEQALAILTSLFGFLALLLAGIGLYGVLTYAVRRRTQEMGIRIALGAQKRDILSLVLWQVVWLILIGIVVGVGAALAANRLVSSLLFGVTATDPLTLALSGVILAAVALLAGYLPARRATKVDPMVALRYE